MISQTINEDIRKDWSICGAVLIYAYCYMSSSVSRQDESNPLL